LKKLYSVVKVTNEVYKEVVEVGEIKDYQDAHIIRCFLDKEGWNVVNLKPQDYCNSFKESLDTGEIATLSYALKFCDALVLVDEELAREEARKKGIKIKGTVGVLIEAYKKEIICFSCLKSLLKEIGERKDIWISESLCKSVIKQL